VENHTKGPAVRDFLGKPAACRCWSWESSRWRPIRSSKAPLSNVPGDIYALARIPRFSWGVVVALAQPVGLYLARVAQDGATFLDPCGCNRSSLPAVRRLLGVRAEQEMSPKVYIHLFPVVSAQAARLLLFLALMCQPMAAPVVPADAYLTTPMTVDLAANTAVSFSTHHQPGKPMAESRRSATSRRYLDW